MPSIINLLQNATELQEFIIRGVTSTDELDGEEYSKKRAYLLQEKSLHEHLPEFLRKCRTLEQANHHIKGLFPSYAERRSFVWESFVPLLDFLERIEQVTTAKSINKVFISYSVKDKAIAGELKNLLTYAQLDSFLAHEDIEISEEWAQRILEEINSCEIFICLLSKNFTESVYCIQETGIAASKKNICIIPLSVDGAIPPGFLAKIQSSKIKGANIKAEDLLPAFINFDQQLATSIIINILGTSGGFRAAENNFNLLKPYIENINNDQAKRLIKFCTENSQIYDAVRCANDLLPTLLRLYSSLMDEDEKRFIEHQIARYRK
jgi:TIR domain